MNLEPMMIPVLSVLDRMLNGPPSLAHDRVIVCMPPLVIEYTGSCPNPPPSSAAPELTLTIAPPPASRIIGMMARQSSQAPVRFTATVRSHLSMSKSQMG